MMEQHFVEVTKKRIASDMWNFLKQPWYIAVLWLCGNIVDCEYVKKTSYNRLNIDYYANEKTINK